MCSVGGGLFSLLIDAFINWPLSRNDVISAAVLAMGIFIGLPVLVFIRGKSSKRTLTISAYGISTEIGKHKGRVPWSKIKVVTETPRFILIANAIGNCFFIPCRAFSTAEDRLDFVAKIRTWMSADT